MRRLGAKKKTPLRGFWERAIIVAVELAVGRTRAKGMSIFLLYFDGHK